MRTDNPASILLGQIAAACLVLGICPAAGHASHFRGGTYNWSRADSTSQVVTFELQQVYRATYFYPPLPEVGSTVTASAAVLRFGDGTQQSGISYTVQGYYPWADIIIVRATITHTYPAPGTFRARLTDGARSTYLLCNQNTLVDHFIYVNTLPRGPIQSPRALLPPLVAIPAGSPSQIAIPIAPGLGTAGDTVRAELDTLLNSGGGRYVLPPGLTLRKSGDQAVITFTPTLYQVGDFGVSMTIMQNGAGSTLEGILTMRDLSRIGPAASLVAPMTAEPPQPVTHITALPGVPLTITYDTNVPASYTDFRYMYGAYPAGASFVPGASPNIVHFHWTPDSASAGRSYPLYLNSVASIPDTTPLGGPPSLYGDDRAHLIVDVVTPALSAPGPDPARSMILERCSPTPTRGMATISFSLPAAANISIEVLDLAGRRVRTVLPSVLRQAGRHAIFWDGKDDNGTVTAPGVYLVRLASSSATASSRIVRLR